MIRLLLIVIFTGSLLVADAQALSSKADIAQANFETEIGKADSLGKSNQFRQAFAIYKDQIEDILSGKIKVEISAEDWKWMLHRAAEAGWRCNNTDLGVRYNNMAFGSHGEKLREKIDFLEQLDIKLYYIYEPWAAGSSNSLVMGRCSTNKTKYLIWFHHEKCFIQQFNECDTYKPAQFTDTALFKLFSNSRKTIIAEEITRLKIGYNHVMHYNFTISSDSGEVTKAFNINDISEYKEGSKEYQRLKETNQLDQYAYNIRSKLRLFNEYSYALVKKYDKFINSPAEREKIGKL